MEAFNLCKVTALTEFKDLQGIRGIGGSGIPAMLQIPPRMKDTEELRFGSVASFNYEGIHGIEGIEAKGLRQLKTQAFLQHLQNVYTHSGGEGSQ